MPVNDRLQIEVARARDTTVIKLHGELDLASAPAFTAELEETRSQDQSAIVIDLTELEFMDSTGLRSILIAHERCEQNGRRFALIPGGRQVARMLEIARVEDHLNLISSLAEIEG
jgi:anti-sigma B factor antagonist